MQYSANEAVRFGNRLIEAGQIAQTRNYKNNQNWVVQADHDTLEVYLEGTIVEDLCVFAELRQEF